MKLRLDLVLCSGGCYYTVFEFYLFCSAWIRWNLESFWIILSSFLILVLLSRALPSTTFICGRIKYKMPVHGYTNPHQAKSRIHCIQLKKSRCCNSHSRIYSLFAHLPVLLVPITKKPPRNLEHGSAATTSSPAKNALSSFKAIMSYWFLTPTLTRHTRNSGLAVIL